MVRQSLDEGRSCVILYCVRVPVHRQVHLLHVQLIMRLRPAEPT